MSERLRSSSSRSSLSIEAPNRSLQTLALHAVSNVWSLSPAAGWEEEHRDPSGSEAQCFCQTVAQRACEWLNNPRLSRRLTFHFVSCYTSKSHLQALLAWDSTALDFIKWNEMFLRCSQYRTHPHCTSMNYDCLLHKYIAISMRLDIIFGILW